MLGPAEVLQKPPAPCAFGTPVLQRGKSSLGSNKKPGQQKLRELFCRMKTPISKVGFFRSEAPWFWHFCPVLLITTILLDNGKSSVVNNPKEAVSFCL